MITDDTSNTVFATKCFSTNQSVASEVQATQGGVYTKATGNCKSNQLNSTQLNSTQLNSTQLNSTQLNSTHLNFNSTSTASHLNKTRVVIERSVHLGNPTESATQMEGKLETRLRSNQVCQFPVS
jgi:hypothetical protein